MCNAAFFEAQSAKLKANLINNGHFSPIEMRQLAEECAIASAFDQHHRAGTTTTIFNSPRVQQTRLMKVQVGFE